MWALAKRLLLLLALTLPVPCWGAVSSVTETDGAPDCYGWQIQFPNGSVTANGNGTCGITFAASAITGTLPIANGGTNNATAYTAGSVIFSNGTVLTQNNAKFFWDNTNNRLGIGTTSPTYTIDATSSAVSDVSANLFRVLAQSGLPGVLISTNASGDTGIDIKGNGGAIKSHLGSNDTTYLNSSTGSVGIGLTGPTELLHLYKAQNASTRLFVQNDTAGTAALAGVVLGTDENANAGTIVSTGSLYNTAVVSAYDPVNLANAFNVIGARGGGMNLIAANGPIRFYTATAASAKGIMDTSGNVGIGTTNPGALLNVYGGNILVNNAGPNITFTPTSGNSYGCHVDPGGGNFYCNNETTGARAFDLTSAGVIRIGTATQTSSIILLTTGSGDTALMLPAQSVSLTTEVTGTLPVANGGTGTTASTGSGSVVLATSPTLTTPTFSGTATGSISGNAATATALAANGANCPANQAAGGVDASGAAESCVATGGTAPVFDRVVRTAGNITTTSTTFTDLTGATITFTTGAFPVVVGQVCVSQHNTLGDLVKFDIAVDGTREGQGSGLVTQREFAADGNVNSSFVHQTAALTAASHTVKVQWKVDEFTGTVLANSAGDPAVPHVFWSHEIR